MTPQELKNSILQLAIQGKLVEQRPEEGTAEELLQQIQTEKAKLVKEGKIKKETPLPKITEDEIPFEIPENWSFQRLGNICYLISGTDLTPDFYNSKECGIPYVTGASNFDNGKIIINRWTVQPSRIAERNDLLITCKGTIGETAILQETQVHIARQVMALRNWNIEIDYLKVFLMTYVSVLKAKAKSMIPGIERKDLLLAVIPLPPLAEQKRIVAKIEELLPLIDRYEQAWTKLEAFNKRFPGDMQKSLLQLAIQGKLVPQRPEEGTGEELYQQIQAEKEKLIKEGKIKKEKPLPEIKEDEIPFDIPESWKWTRLQIVSMTIVDCPHSTPQYYENITGFFAIGTKCMTAKGEISKLFNVDEETYRRRTERLVPEKNDIVYSREGSIVCRAVLLPEDKKICLGQRVMLIRCPEGVSPLFLQQYLMSDQTVSLLTQNYKGVGVKHINVSDVCSLPIPLPPLAEQKRIVAKLNELLPLCERLK